MLVAATRSSRGSPTALIRILPGKCERTNRPIKEYTCHICNVQYEWEGENNGLPKGSERFHRFCSIECKYAYQIFQDCYNTTYGSVQQAIHEFCAKIHGFALRIINRNNETDHDHYEQIIFDLLFDNKHRRLSGLPVIINRRRIRICKEILYRLLGITTQDFDNLDLELGDAMTITREQFQALDINSAIPLFNISEGRITENLDKINQAMCSECQFTAQKTEIEYYYYLGICAECSAERTIEAEKQVKEKNKGKEKEILKEDVMVIDVESLSGSRITRMVSKKEKKNWNHCANNYVKQRKLSTVNCLTWIV